MQQRGRGCDEDDAGQPEGAAPDVLPQDETCKHDEREDRGGIDGPGRVDRSATHNLEPCSEEQRIAGREIAQRHVAVDPEATAVRERVAGRQVHGGVGREPGAVGARGDHHRDSGGCSDEHRAEPVESRRDRNGARHDA